MIALWLIAVLAVVLSAGCWAALTYSRWVHRYDDDIARLVATVPVED